MRSCISLCLANLVLTLTAIAQTSTSATVPPQPECPPQAALSPEAQQAASDLHIAAKIEQLQADACKPLSIEQLALHQQIADAVFAASLDVNSIVGQIDFERAQILESRTILANRQSHALNLLSLANLVVSGGSGILTNAMQFGSSSTAYAGDGVGIAGGGAGAILSMLGLRVTGGTTSLGISPNMLAAIFNREPEKHSVYPPEVWAYLNTVPAAYPHVHQSWRQELIQQWIREKRIGPPEAPATQKKIHLLTSPFAEHSRVSLDVLVDRTLMLLDLRARVALMNGALRDILVAINASTAGAAADESPASGIEQ